MDRRAFLAAAGCALTAGCALSDRETLTAVDPEPERTTRVVTPADTGPPGARGYPSTVCQEEAKADPGIYAVTDPVFAPDWSRGVPERYRLDETAGLAARATVVGVGGRAYPLSVLWHHEIVNDRVTVDGRERPVAVTYCPLCRSGVVADRTVAGRPATFRVSGLLWVPPRLQTAVAEEAGRVFGATREEPDRSVRNTGNLVMVDDATGSYWSQLLARGICGPEAGTALALVPATVTTWGEWRSGHPDGEVLLPPPASETTAPG
jgi:hypothetical protein